jgi:hypothetical protein
MKPLRFINEHAIRRASPGQLLGADRVHDTEAHWPLLRHETEKNTRQSAGAKSNGWLGNLLKIRR